MSENPRYSPSDEEKKNFFKLYLSNVRADIIIGFILVAVITIGAMAIGFLGYHSSFIPADTELNVDLLISMVLNLIQDFPIISYILLVLFVALFFGAIVIGLDARASAITKVVKSMRLDEGKPLKNSSLVYNLSLIGFLLLVIMGMFYNKPLEVLVNISMFCAIFFGIYGFIMIYLNSKLPEYARGSRLWMLIIGIGSAISIIVALLIEKSLLEYGIPLIQKLALVLVVIFLLCRSKMFSRLANGTSTIVDKVWLVVILGCVAIAGTISGVGSIEYGEGLFITFRDIGPILAGIIGGPIVGAIVGIIGGISILVAGGTAAGLGCIGTILAGILAGIMIRVWKGKLTLLRSILLGLGIECLLLLSILPTYLMLTGMSATTTLESILTIAPSMVFAVSLGIVCFWLFTKQYPEYQSAIQKFSIKRIVQDIKDLKSTRTESNDYTEEKK